MCASCLRPHEAPQKLPCLEPSLSIFSQAVRFSLVDSLFYVQMFFLVKHVPEWMPGAGFKKKAKEWRKLSQAMINVPYEMVKEKFVSRWKFPT